MLKETMLYLARQETIKDFMTHNPAGRRVARRFVAGETLDEAIRYRVRTSADGGPVGPCVLAGPTCDSADVLYERVPVRLPLSLAEGDTVRLMSAGAYTTCYSTVGFNGFPPLRTRLV